MNSLLRLLEDGDIRSDGRADAVAAEIIVKPQLFGLLWDGIYESNDIVRARTAHALEKVSREMPELFDEFLDQIIDIALDDNLPMVKWHFAMLVANLNLSTQETKKVINLLIKFLNNKSVFVKTWSISSLTIIALKRSEYKQLIISEISFLKEDKSRAVRNRVNKSLNVLEKGMKMPKGWIKSNSLKIYFK
ncbi:MAG: hypothetical protein Kow0019_17860 [Methanobacteriaceae archaeon]